MKSKNFLKALLISCVIVLFARCVNLNRVSDYSSNAAKGLKKFEELGYNFNQACHDRCEIEQLKKQQLLAQGCDCQSENDADRITGLIYKATKGYFEGLTKLSDKSLTVYKFNALQKAFKEGDFGDVKITREHVTSYTKISNILTNVITDTYRKRKLVNYIGEANDAIKILLNALEFNLVQNLSKKLDIKKQRLESYYFDLSIDTTVSAYENKKIIEEFNIVLNAIDTKKKQIAVFGKGIINIAEGHQKLYDNRNKLNTGEIKELLAQHAGDIRDIVDEFIILKNQH